MNFLASGASEGTAGRSRPGRRKTRKVLGYVIKLSNGTKITDSYVDRRLPPSDVEHVFRWTCDCHEFIQIRRSSCVAQGIQCVFDIYSYRFVPVYA